MGLTITLWQVHVEPLYRAEPTFSEAPPRPRPPPPSFSMPTPGPGALTPTAPAR